MNTLGNILIVIAILLGGYALTMDTSVAVNFSTDGLPQRINNLGLMRDQQNYLITAGILAIVGFLMILVDKKDSPKKVNSTFKLSLDKARFAESKGNYKEALDLYFETIYHLENDNVGIKLSKDEEKSRIDLIREMNEKVSVLGNRI